MNIGNVTSKLLLVVRVKLADRTLLQQYGLWTVNIH
jgi:hypothetical protein